MKDRKNNNIISTIKNGATVATTTILAKEAYELSDHITDNKIKISDNQQKNRIGIIEKGLEASKEAFECITESYNKANRDSAKASIEHHEELQRIYPNIPEEIKNRAFEKEHDCSIENSKQRTKYIGEFAKIVFTGLAIGVPAVALAAVYNKTKPKPFYYKR